MEELFVSGVGSFMPTSLHERLMLTLQYLSGFTFKIECACVSVSVNVCVCVCIYFKDDFVGLSHCHQFT